MVGASVATRPMSGVMIAMRERGKMMYAEANTVGTMPRPIKPWMARHTIISFIEEVNPHIRLAKVKPAAAVANMMRVPSARDRKPDSGMATTSATRYDVCTQVISSLDAANPAWISVSDADTTWM